MHADPVGQAPVRPSPARWRAQGSISPWMAAVAGWTTSSSSGCGGRSSMRTSISRAIPTAARPRQGCELDRLLRRSSPSSGARVSHADGGLARTDAGREGCGRQSLWQRDRKGSGAVSFQLTNRFKLRRPFPRYAALERRVLRLRRKIERLRAEGADQAEIHAALAEIKAVNKERRKVPSVGPINPNFKGLHSCRYADDCAPRRREGGVM